MKRLSALVLAITLLGASLPAKSTVGFRVQRTGCLRLKPNFPVWLTVGRADASFYDNELSEYFSDYVVDERNIAPFDSSVSLSLEPGYYWASISAPRCWASHQRFVVGSHWDRTVRLDPGIELPPLRYGESLFIDVLRLPSSGLVIHAAPNTSKVLLRAEQLSALQVADRSGNIWYFDYGGVGRARITMYAGRRIVAVKNTTLMRDRFLELYYPSVLYH